MTQEDDKGVASAALSIIERLRKDMDVSKVRNATIVTRSQLDALEAALAAGVPANASSDEAAWIRACTAKISDAIGGGSELFTRHGDEFRLDIDFVCKRISEMRNRYHDAMHRAIRAERACTPPPEVHKTSASANAWHTACVNVLWTRNETYKLFYEIKDFAEKLENESPSPETHMGGDRRLLQWDIRKDRNAYPEGPLAKDKAIYTFTVWEGGHRGSLLLTKEEADFVSERLTTANPSSSPREDTQ